MEQGNNSQHGGYRKGSPPLNLKCFCFSVVWEAEFHTETYATYETKHIFHIKCLFCVKSVSVNSLSGRERLFTLTPPTDVWLVHARLNVSSGVVRREYYTWKHLLTRSTRFRIRLLSNVLYSHHISDRNAFIFNKREENNWKVEIKCLTSAKQFEQVAFVFWHVL